VLGRVSHEAAEFAERRRFEFHARQVLATPMLA
jgi:hypothetical protein